MIVLGIAESKDRKGTELEELTRRLLEAMGYINIVKNKIDSGGSEIDVSADFVMPTPGAERRQRLICECKAYRSPIDTVDWLKFLGKVFQEQSLRQQEVIGWSPGALAYALQPDPMIVTHRVAAADKSDDFNVEDAKIFLRTLHQHLVSDFVSGPLIEYFHKVRGIVEIDRTEHIAIKSKQKMLHDASVRQRSVIGEAAQELGGGYVLILAREDLPEPWEGYSKAKSASETNVAAGEVKPQPPTASRS
jgi:hypothetical protein